MPFNYPLSHCIPPTIRAAVLHPESIFTPKRFAAVLTDKVFFHGFMCPFSTTLWRTANLVFYFCGKCFSAPRTHLFINRATFVVGSFFTVSRAILCGCVITSKKFSTINTLECDRDSWFILRFLISAFAINRAKASRSSLGFLLERNSAMGTDVIFFFFLTICHWRYSNFIYFLPHRSPSRTEIDEWHGLHSAMRFWTTLVPPRESGKM